ncbi:H-2 class II histocompatibility antigen, A-U alpha chain-like [Lepisosteus oculatus]|uniref:H-2 class II histocompatibility antigen, A-U alpha chain-like n=1 Tax=Lepisosteus oculatus TaxID=7918 RepID=UPI0035F52E39
MLCAFLTAVLLGASGVLSQAQIRHLDRRLTFCASNSTEAEFEIEHDEDEILYVDLVAKKTVLRIPEFAEEWHPYPEQPSFAQQEVETCRHNVAVSAKGEGFPEEKLDPPISRLYSENEVELGVPNALICFITDFHPAPVKVSWTRNTERVTQGFNVTQYYSNKDYSLRLFSYLSFTPQAGDVYSCSVEHRALQEPLTRLWEVEVQSDSEAAETAVCGVGLTLGLLGVAAGTFFLIKGNKCN